MQTFLHIPTLQEVLQKKLLGFNLIKNFNKPYLAISPSDFWRRWHISFSTWIRDYLYIPLGGGRVKNKFKLFLVLMTSMGISGLWHGAAWTFVAWGTFHGLLLYLYRVLGLGGRWHPDNRIISFIAWLVMFLFICFSWSIFRASSLTWLVNIFSNDNIWGLSGESLVTSVVIFLYLIFYTSPLMLFMYIDRVFPDNDFMHSFVCGLSLLAIVIFFRSSGQDFIYFQF